MGGRRSGGSNRGKNNVNQFRHVDIQLIQKQRCLKEPCSSFVYPWGADRVALCNFDGYNLNILCDLNNDGYIVKIGKTRTNCGYRSWFICPGCGRRVAKIYYRWSCFKCRTCQRLNYSSSQQSHNKMEQINRKIYKIQDRLKVQYDPLNTYDIPKPKRMHYKTYERLMDKLAELDRQSEGAFVSECERKLKIKP